MFDDIELIMKPSSKISFLAQRQFLFIIKLSISLLIAEGKIQFEESKADYLSKVLSI
jgi:hypothetical protein